MASVVGGAPNDLTRDLIPYKILQGLSVSRVGLGFSEILKIVECSKATLAVKLKQFEEQGIVEKPGESRLEHYKITNIGRNKLQRLLMDISVEQRRSLANPADVIVFNTGLNAGSIFVVPQKPLSEEQKNKLQAFLEKKQKETAEGIKKIAGRNEYGLVDVSNESKFIRV